MRIAFYAPMKSPSSPRPSGDRKIARLFMAALTAAKYQPILASEFRSWEGNGNSQVQQKLKQEGAEIAQNLVAQFQSMDDDKKPKAWFTYHLYHKAPDWIGPIVSAALGIPYLIAEASISPKQLHGRWNEGHQSSIAAVHQAARIFCINPRDILALKNTLGSAKKLVPVAPFLERGTTTCSADKVRSLKIRLAAQYKLDPDQYWLLTAAMMREDSKLESYKILAQSVEKIQRKDWQLIVVGDGVAETLVRELFRNDFERRVHFIGRKDENRIDQLMQASDLFVWPAVNEALGMVVLESLSNGLPAVCGRSGGIAQIIEHGKTGVLLDHPDQPDASSRFASAIESLLTSPAKLAEMRSASIRKYEEDHQLRIAANQLASHLDAALKEQAEFQC